MVYNIDRKLTKNPQASLVISGAMFDRFRVMVSTALGLGKIAGGFATGAATPGAPQKTPASPQDQLRAALMKDPEAMQLVMKEGVMPAIQQIMGAPEAERMTVVAKFM
jgi:hypothetical protein